MNSYGGLSAHFQAKTQPARTASAVPPNHHRPRFMSHCALSSQLSRPIRWPAAGLSTTVETVQTC